MAPQHRYRRFAACGRRRGDHGRLHNSVLRPLNRARDERGCQVRVAAILPDGSLDWESYERALVGASLVVATHASNVTGDVYDIERMAAFARKADALFCP